MVVVEEEDDDAVQRRRRRRRRRRSLKSDSPERKIRVFLLVVVILLLILALTGAQVGAWLKETTAGMQSNGLLSGLKEGIKKFLRWEVIALLIAALILLYLQPGMEEQVLRALGLKKDRRRQFR